MAATNSILSLPSAAGSPTNGLRDIKPPVEIPSGWAWAWWVLGAIVAGAARLVAMEILAETAGCAPPASADTAACPRPPTPGGGPGLAQPAQAFVIAVSDTLRAYLEERFSFRAPERTTEEFLHELQSTNLLDASQKERLSEFLQRCDLVKFAKYEPREMELRDLHASALRLVDETEPRDLAPTASGNMMTFGYPWLLLLLLLLPLAAWLLGRRGSSAGLRLFLGSIRSRPVRITPLPRWRGPAGVPLAGAQPAHHRPGSAPLHAQRNQNHRQRRRHHGRPRHVRQHGGRGL